MIESPSLAGQPDPLRQPTRPDIGPRPRPTGANEGAATGSGGRCFDDLPREHGFEPLRVEGAVPLELRGRVYRNGPGMVRSFDEPCAHWLDGDGVVSAVWFERGKAAGAARVVETPGLAAERRAGRRLFSGLAMRSPAPLREHLLGRRKNRANRSVFAWGGRLLALGGGAPVELSTADLSVRGELDAEALGTARLGPRVRRLASRRAAYGFAAAPWGSSVELFRFGDDGEVHRLGNVMLPWPAAVTDMIVTTRHFVFCLPPLRAAGWRAALRMTPGLDDLVWDHSMGTAIVVVPIDDPERARTIAVEGFYPHHFVNAFERGSELVIDVCASDDLDRAQQWYRALPAGERGASLDSSLRRIAVDLRGGGARGELLLERSCSLPCVAPAARGEPYRYSYLVGHSSRRAASGLPDRLIKLDVESGRSWELELGPDQFPSEPVFVPSEVRGTPEPSEDDGWLIVEVYDAIAHRSHAAIIDAARFDEPVARAHFGHHLPYSLHGTWVPSKG